MKLNQFLESHPPSSTIATHIFYANSLLRVWLLVNRLNSIDWSERRHSKNNALGERIRWKFLRSFLSLPIKSFERNFMENSYFSRKCSSNKNIRISVVVKKQNREYRNRHVRYGARAVIINYTLIHPHFELCAPRPRIFYHNVWCYVDNWNLISHRDNRNLLLRLLFGQYNLRNGDKYDEKENFIIWSYHE